MARNVGVPKHNPSCLGTAGVVLLWFALSALAALVAWIVLVAVLIVAGWIVANPALRPFGWATSTLVGVNKLSLLILGSGWLILIMYMERDLRVARDDGRLQARTIRYLILFAVIALPCAVVILI